MKPRAATFAERRARRAAIADPAVVLDAAARSLEARSRSVAEVRRRLGSAGYRPELVDVAVCRLIELGILDDAAFARAWVESRDRAHPRGEAALRRELRLKGIDRAVVDAVLEERGAAPAPSADPGAPSDPGAPAALPAPAPDVAAADRLLARHARALARVAHPGARRQRAYALLARNGFDPDTAADAIRRFVDAADDG